MSEIRRIALIGFGEVGQVLAEDLSAPDVSLTAFDLKFADPESGPTKALDRHKVEAARSAAEAVSEAGLVISAVTAAQDVTAAQSVSGGLKWGPFFLDLNSASPGMKGDAAQIIESAGGRYVEAAVMSPIAPKRIASPILTGGPHAADFLPVAQSLGFGGMSVCSEKIGVASATKMCRSVMIKGLEALLSESLLAARHYGVEKTVLASMTDLLPATDWAELSRYMISRSLEHGVRRAEEMREVARTVTDAGFEPLMSLACASRQDWMSGFGEALNATSLEEMLDTISKLNATNAKREAKS
jgi:3-hydroxyisobutyrate dehydrogenase-like beta-hydroxyacid dehydrogenase